MSKELFKELDLTIAEIRKENTRLLELCMYGLIRDTKIYNREIDDVTKLKFMSTIKNNLTDDTYTLRKKLINIWKSGEQMEANYVHKDSTTLVQDELVKNELNQIELQYNALKQQKFNELLKENQELKLELSGYRQAILNNKEMLGLKEQNEELKNKYNIRLLNQISENIEPDCEDYYLAEIETKAHKYDLIQNQQKEFIKYLEDEISKQKNDIFANALTSEDIDLYIMKIKLQELEEVLQKYKEIIGDDK